MFLIFFSKNSPDPNSSHKFKVFINFYNIINFINLSEVLKIFFACFQGIEIFPVLEELLFDNQSFGLVTYLPVY